MKLIVLMICLGYAMASDKFLEELESILASKETAADSAAVDAQADKVMGNLLKSLKEDEREEKRSPLFDILMASEDMSDDIDGKRGLNNKRKSYGYCMDGKTKADGPNQAGCAKKLCYDDQVDTCDKMFAEELKMTDEEKRKNAIKSKCIKIYKYAKMVCPYTCGYCKPRSPKKQCEDNFKFAPHGCCLIGNYPALKPDKSDCIKCRDFYPHSCRQFKTNRYGIHCATNSYRVRSFLESRCAVTCHRCRAGEQ